MRIIRSILNPQSSYSFKNSTGEAIIFHTTLGNTYQGAHQTLKLRHLSYHFIIDTDGTIYQLIDTNRAAWGAGATANMNMRAKVFFGTTNPNVIGIQVAFVRFGHKYLTPMQRDAGVWLVKHIGSVTGKRYTWDNTFSHFEVTNYSATSKPREVANYRQQVMDGVVGFKDNKDNKEKTRMLLYIQYLQLQLKLLRLRLQGK